MPKRIAAAVAGLIALLLPSGTTRAADGPAPGTVLNDQTWSQAVDLLPPEILEHYKRGDYSNAIAEWKDGDVRWSAAFLSATQANAGRFAINSEGTIVDKADGKRPDFIYGFPFPTIDPADPTAGVQVLWNYYYAYWSNGSRRNTTSLVWLGRTSAERSAVEEVYFRQFDGQPPEYRPKDNPDDLLQQFLATTFKPADLQGTAALTWRYRAARKRDSNWAFVPALRRVRQVSPANRSDGFLGSEMSQDDGPFFDGKPEDFTWKLTGAQKILRLADPYSLGGDYKYEPLPGGGWRVPFKAVPMVGFQQSGWRGVAWAPVNFVLVQRPCWIIEGVPRDPYYLYGKMQLFVDKENFRGAWNRKFDWGGQLVATYQIGGYLNGTPDGTHYLWGHGLYYQVAENMKMGRATFAGAPPPETRDAANDFFVSYPPEFFNSQSLMRFGK